MARKKSEPSAAEVYAEAASNIRTVSERVTPVFRRPGDADQFGRPGRHTGQAEPESSRG